MTNIFESKHYPTIMYVFILITILAILFNLVNITNSTSNSSKTDRTIKFTGYAVSNLNAINNTNLSQSEKQELYSENSYGVYYLILIAIGIMISLVLVTFIIPRIKHLT